MWFFKKKSAPVQVQVPPVAPPVQKPSVDAASLARTIVGNVERDVAYQIPSFRREDVIRSVQRSLESALN